MQKEFEKGYQLPVIQSVKENSIKKIVYIAVILATFIVIVTVGYFVLVGPFKGINLSDSGNEPVLDEGNNPTNLLPGGEINLTNYTQPEITGGSSSGGGSSGGGSPKSTPNCLGKVCGDDGAGGSCGECLGNLTCNYGFCVECVRDSDCSEGKICENRRCVSGCKDACYNEGNFCDGNYIYQCQMNTTSGCYYKNYSTYCGFKEICSNGACIDETFSAQVIFEDDFEDGNYNISDPRLINGLTWEKISGGIGVTKSLTNNSLGLSRLNTSVLSEQIMPLSFTLEADVRITWSHPIRIIFAYIDNNNYYYFGINGKTGVYRIMNGVETKLDDTWISGYYSMAHAGSSQDRYKVYFDNNGSEIKMFFGRKGYADGLDYELEIIDTNLEAVNKFKQGRIGFNETNGENAGTYWVNIDNVVVYGNEKENQRPLEKRDYYVSNYGLDSNSGTVDYPFRTLGRAASEVKAGETVYIFPGIYREGSVPITYCGSGQAPITIKAWDSNNKPVFTGTTTLDSSEWVSYGSNIYKAVIEWRPSSLYLNDIPLFIAQEPNQQDPNDQMQTEYFINVSDENDDSKPQAHYELIDSNFFTQSDPNYWKGATLLLFDGYINAIDTVRQVMEYLPSEHKIRVPYGRWVEIGDLSRHRDKFALRNHLAILDKPGEYVIDKGRLDVLSWRENEDTLDISLKMVSGIGEVSSIAIYFINDTSGQSFTIDTKMVAGEVKDFSINMSGKIRNNLYVYAEVSSTSLYEVYVWPYEGYLPEQIEISKQSSFVSFGRAYNDYIIFDGLELKHYSGTAFNFESSGAVRYNTVRNCDIHHNMGSGIGVRCDIQGLIASNPNVQGRCSGLIVEDSKLHNNFANGIGFGGGRNFTVQRCEIWENLDNGIWSGNGATSPLYVWDVYIKNNYIHDQGSDRTHPDNIQLYRTANTLIDGNYLVQKGHQNVWISHCGPVQFTNNIIKNGPTGINSANESYNYNNIFYKSTVRYDAHQEEDDPIEIPYTEIAEAKNNIFIDSTYTLPDKESLWQRFNFENNFFAVNGLNYIYRNRNKNNLFYPKRNSSLDVLDDLPGYFREATNFTLEANSPLIDAGAYGIYMPKIDRNNQRRWQGVAIDIGASEVYNSYSYQDCFNHIKDGNEEGVDCGGICAQDFDNDGYKIGLCSGLMDCNDSELEINPGKEELCDSIDNNCDGLMHDSYSLDSDGDGFNDCIDNCPNNNNGGQEDFDLDKIGDVCDSTTTYADDFERRYLGPLDLFEIKSSNGLSWTNLIGNSSIVIGTDVFGRGSKLLRSGSLGGYNTLTVTNQDFSEFNLSLYVGNSWSTDGGLVLYLEDKDNFYFLGIGNSGSSLINSSQYAAGGLYRVVNGQAVLIDSNSSLRLPHTGGIFEKFIIQTEPAGDGLHFKISRINSSGAIFKDEFVDTSPAFNSGKIGFYKVYLQGMNLDNVKIDVANESYLGSFKASSSSFLSSIMNWLKSILTGNTIKEITGNFMRIFR